MKVKLQVLARVMERRKLVDSPTEFKTGNAGASSRRYLARVDRGGSGAAVAFRDSEGAPNLCRERISSVAGAAIMRSAHLHASGVGASNRDGPGSGTAVAAADEERVSNLP